MERNREYFEIKEHCHYSGLPSMHFYEQELSRNELSASDVDRIIEMAWEDRTPFEAILQQFGKSEAEVIELMRNELKRSSFNRWRKRVSGRATKHRQLREVAVNRFRCTLQRMVTANKISKR